MENVEGLGKNEQRNVVEITAEAQTDKAQTHPNICNGQDFCSTLHSRGFDSKYVSLEITSALSATI